MEYYFVGASLPDLRVGYPAELSFREFARLLRLNLTEADFHRTVVVRRYYDIQNIRFFWKGQPLNPKGVFNENELEEALLTRSGFPDYVYAYLDRYEQKEERIEHFPELMADYFRAESEAAGGFLQEYLQFEREWRLVLAGFRAKSLGKDLATELQYENPHDDLIAQILAQKDAEHYEPPARFEELKGVFEEYGEEPLVLHQAICEWRFQKIEEMCGYDPFSVDRLLAYLAQLIIVERWMELDKERGMNIVGKLIEDAS